MSIMMRNRFLQNLHRDGASRKQILYIMEDIDSPFDVAGVEHDPIFQDADVADYYDEVESVADVLWAKDSSVEEKRNALKSLKEEKPVKKTGKKGKLLITEKMILTKQREYIAMGLVPEGNVIQNDLDDLDDLDPIMESNVRYGRSPLHEAIAYRNMDLVKKYIKEKKYLDSTDNNGNTPREMAFYDGWMDAVKLFDIVC